MCLDAVGGVIGELYGDHLDLEILFDDECLLQYCFCPS